MDTVWGCDSLLAVYSISSSDLAQKHVRVPVYTSGLIRFHLFTHSHTHARTHTHVFSLTSFFYYSIQPSAGSHGRRRKEKSKTLLTIITVKIIIKRYILTQRRKSGFFLYMDLRIFIPTFARAAMPPFPRVRLRVSFLVLCDAEWCIRRTSTNSSFFIVLVLYAFCAFIFYPFLCFFRFFFLVYDYFVCCVVCRTFFYYQQQYGWYILQVFLFPFFFFFGGAEPSPAT